VLAVAAAILLLAWQLRDLIAPVIAAVVIAIALNSPTRWLERHTRLSRAQSVGAVVLSTTLLLGTIIIVVTLSLIEELSRAWASLPKIILALEKLPILDNLQIDPSFLSNSVFQSQIADGLPGALQGAMGFAGSLLAVLIGVFVTAALTAFLLAEGPGLWRAAVRTLSAPHAILALRLARVVQPTVARSMFAMLVQACLAGLTIFTVLTILGVEGAAGASVIVALTALIPFIGAALGALVAGSLALTVSPTALIVVLVSVVVYQLLENHLIAPLLQRRFAGPPSSLVLVGILVGAQLAGVLGALIAIPLTAALIASVRGYSTLRRAERQAAQTEK